MLTDKLYHVKIEFDGDPRRGEGTNITDYVPGTDKKQVEASYKRELLKDADKRSVGIEILSITAEEVKIPGYRIILEKSSV